MRKFLKYLEIINDAKIDNECLTQEYFDEETFNEGLIETIKALSEEEKNAFIYKLLFNMANWPSDEVLSFVVEDLIDDNITEEAEFSTDFIYNLKKLNMPFYIFKGKLGNGGAWCEAIENIDYKNTDFIDYFIVNEEGNEKHIVIDKIFK